MLFGFLAAGCGVSGDGLDDDPVDPGDESPGSPAAGPDAARSTADAGRPAPGPEAGVRLDGPTTPPPPPPPDAGAVPRDGSAPPPPPPPPRDAAPPPPPNGWVGGPAIVGVGYGGRRVVSRDATTWSPDIQDTRGNVETSGLFRDVAYAGGIVVAVGGGCSPACAGRIATFNGDRWTEIALPAGQSWLSGVAHGNGLWVAAGAQGPALFSSDAKKWTQTRSLPGVVRRVAFGDVGGTPMFVAVGDGGLRLRSVDGQNWTNPAWGFPGSEQPVALAGLAIGRGTVVAAGAGGRRIRSRNGIDWTDAAAGGNQIGTVVFVEDRFMAYDGMVVHLSTDDGRTWSPQTLITSSPVDAVATGMMGGTRLYVGVTWPARIKTSSNGLAWMTRVSGEDQNALTRFVFAGN